MRRRAAASRPEIPPSAALPAVFRGV